MSLRQNFVNRGYHSYDFMSSENTHTFINTIIMLDILIYTTIIFILEFLYSQKYIHIYIYFDH